MLQKVENVVTVHKMKDVNMNVFCVCVCVCVCLQSWVVTDYI